MGPEKADSATDANERQAGAGAFDEAERGTALERRAKPRRPRYLGVLPTLRSAWGSIRRFPSSASSKKKPVRPSFSPELETRCYGRFLLDVPRGSVAIESETYSYAFATIAADRNPMTAEQFNNVIDLRIRLLKSRSDRHQRMLFSAVGRISECVRWVASWREEDEARDVAGFALIDGSKFTVSGVVYDEDDFSDFKNAFLALVPRLRPMRNGALPDGRGFCVSGGYVEGGNERSESVSSGFLLPGMPDLLFTVRTRTNGARVDAGVLDRETGSAAARIGRHMGALGTQVTLRSARRTVGGMAAQEWIVKDPPGENWRYKFILEIPGEPMSNAAPNIVLTMRLHGARSEDGDEPFNMTEAEAIRLWDAITGTLRLRPGAL
jgi:hypothetical protein